MAVIPTEPATISPLASIAVEQALRSAETASFLASSPLEAFSALPAPTQFSIQVWELMHIGVGLPWWASIPLTTLTLRLLLLPLTLKARAASANFSLWGSAFSTASSALGQHQGPPLAFKDRYRAASAIYRYLRAKHRTPATWWYIANTMVQVPLFITMSIGLRRMCDIQWPGLGGEGLLALSDLTAPSVALSTWATPYGVFGLFLPLAIFGTYNAALQYSPAYRSHPSAATALDVLALPYLCASFITPQAVLLYWLSNSTFHLGLQALTSKPHAAKALGLPMLLVHSRSDADSKAKKELQQQEVQQLADTSADPSLLMLIAEEQLASGYPAAAAGTFQRALQLQPGLQQALEGAALALSAAQDHLQAAELSTQAAASAANPAKASELHLLAASSFLTAASHLATVSPPTTSAGTSPAAPTPPAPASSPSAPPDEVKTSTQKPQAAKSKQSTKTQPKVDQDLLSKARASAEAAAQADPSQAHPLALLALCHLLGGSPALAAPHIITSLQLLLPEAERLAAASGSTTGVDSLNLDSDAVDGTSAGASSGSRNGVTGAGDKVEAAMGKVPARVSQQVVQDAVAVGRRVLGGLAGGEKNLGFRSQLDALLGRVEEIHKK